MHLPLKSLQCVYIYATLLLIYHEEDVCCISIPPTPELFIGILFVFYSILYYYLSYKIQST